MSGFIRGPSDQAVAVIGEAIERFCIMTFPLGKPILLMLCIAVAGSVAMSLAPRASRADLRVWVYADQQAETYRQGVARLPNDHSAEFAPLAGHTIEISLIAQRALNVRMMAMLLAGPAAAPPPDVCEVDIGSIAAYLNGPIDDIGLLPLNDFIRRDGLEKGFVASRWAAYTCLDPRTGRRVIFGLPHDVHPVTLTYRKDLFNAAGLDPSAATTWPQLQAICLRYQSWQRAHGNPDAAAIQIPTSASEVLLAMLLQRHVNLVDDSDNVHLADPLVVSTVCFYARLCAGADRIAIEPTPGAGLWARDVGAGRVAMIVTPDWRIAELKDELPELAGKLRMMPLPRFDPSDAPTSTWGGTMGAIPRRCADPERAWTLLKYLYCSPASLSAQSSPIIPADLQLWGDPSLHRPDPYFGGQAIGSMYIDLAAHLPERIVTPYSILAQAELTVVLRRAVDLARQDPGADPLQSAVAQWLRDGAADLQQRIAFGNLQ
jgi:arabinosaccharide transport system substrate-binding protein